VNGAQALIRTLVANGVDTCFTNPGTSEMHFVAALDDVPDMRGVLGLFEGVCTGAADGYARMAERSAATLLHLGPGLGNGIANLHNARRARVPLVNIVGDHATYHTKFDAPLESDIAALASNVSGWIRRSTSPSAVAGDGAAAVAAAEGPPGQVATLILPADVCWTEGAEPVGRARRPGSGQVPDAVVTGVLDALRSGEPAMILLGGSTLREPGLVAASRCARATGARLLAETFPTRLTRGSGVPAVDRVAYLAELAALQFEGLRHLVLVDTAAPVSFFAYPDRPSSLVPDGCTVHTLASGSDDAVGALEHLADALGADQTVDRAPTGRPDRPTGDLTAETVCAALGATLPENAVVSDEGATGGIYAAGATAGAPPHDWLTLTGGAIGQGIPVATGAAIAAPDRPVVNLQAEGSALYTLQGLWTQAREGLDVTTVILNNRSYAILNMELARVGAGEPGPLAKRMLDLSGPDLDFMSMSEGLGVPAERAEDAEDFTAKLEKAIAEPGPHLIEAVVPAGF